MKLDSSSYKQHWVRAREFVSANHDDLAWGLKTGVLIGAAALVLGLPPMSGAHRAMPSMASVSASQFVSRPAGRHALPPLVAVEDTAPRHADFADQAPSRDARRTADWVADSHDNRGMPFVVLDKRNARVFAFDREARLTGSTLVLLGSATGDDSTPGIGNKTLAEIKSDERTTPAGRFVSVPGHDVTGEDVVWVDYDNSVAMHRVKVVDPKERRFERIATDSIDDKRISNGCINVPVAFYDSVISPALGRGKAVVYVLPEVKTLEEVFGGMYDVDSPDRPIGGKATKTANL